MIILLIISESARERKAQRMLVKEVTKQLPSNLSKNSIEKRIERARKIYDLFSTIGFDKIQRVKTPVSQIYRLSWMISILLERNLDRLLRHSHVISADQWSEKSKRKKINI